MPATITRIAYDKKAHHRKSYVRKDGVKVKATNVKAAHVPKTKIKDRGAPGKGKKVISMKDYRHLGKYGYSLKKVQERRHSALKKAAKKNGYSWAIRRLNAIATLFKNTEPKLSHKAIRDIKFMQKHKKELNAKTEISRVSTRQPGKYIKRNL